MSTLGWQILAAAQGFTEAGSAGELRCAKQALRAGQCGALERKAPGDYSKPGQPDIALFKLSLTQTESPCLASVFHKTHLKAPLNHSVNAADRRSGAAYPLRGLEFMSRGASRRMKAAKEFRG